MSKFKVGDFVVYSHKLYNTVRFNKGDTFKVTAIYDDGTMRLESVSSKHIPSGSYTPDQFELVQEGVILTPEEVFAHLRKDTKLQWRHNGKDRWQDCVHSGNVQVRCILDSEWRVKPEPEVIELNGKKYREIVE